jgi:serine protease Do
MGPGRASAVKLARLALSSYVAMVLVAAAAQPAMAQVRSEPIVPDWVRLARELKPSVVYIIAKGIEGESAGNPRKWSGLERFFWLHRQSGGRSHGRDATVTSLGTGFVLTPDGYIGTNNHVLEKFTNIHVKLDDGVVYKATVVGQDPRIDLALLKLGVTGLPPITLADSSAVQVGESVMAIGNPFGLERTVTVGVVSATARATGERPWDKYIQTDAAINPGNSGGPLINAEGRMIGVTTTFYSPSGASIGIGFAIPANLARATLERIAGKPLTSAP